MGALPEGGAMLAIEASEAEALAAIGDKEQLLSLAAVNSPNATVVSGEEQAIEEVEAHFKAEGRKTKRLQVSHAFHSPLIEPMLEQFSEVVSSLSLNEPALPVISNLTGEQLTPEQATDPAYWTSHAREPVRFADAVKALREKGATTYLEIGPDPVLTAMASATLGEDAKAALIPTLREGREEPKALALSLGAAHAAGAKLDWDAYFKGTGANRVPLPTYPFQRKRYWLSASSASGDPGAAGQANADHPLLSAVLEDPEGGIVLTGRIGLQTHPWLVDHAAFGIVLFPGTALLELALRAGAQVGCELLEELVLQAPLAVPESGSIALRVSLSPQGEDGRREVSIHSRPERGRGEEPGEWVLHAQGVLTAEGLDHPPEQLGPWPPRDAEPIELDSLYQRLAEAGLEYGPAFQGVDSAWQVGEEIYAEVSLAGEQASEAARFGVHPALLDSAFHVALEIVLAQGRGKAMLPLVWQGVSLAGPGAGALRVRLELGEQRMGIAAFAETGEPVLSVASVLARDLDPALLRPADPGEELFTVEWKPAPAGPGEHEADREQARLITPAELDFAEDADPATTALAATESALALIQDWLAEEAHAEERLVLLTEGAVATSAEEGSELVGAALRGLVRSARSEHPGRFALIDTDGSEASAEALTGALERLAEEPEVALRNGALLVPRIAVVKPAETESAAAPLDPGATVLVTGGLSGIGARVARHLVERHGQRHLLLVSRRGSEAEGAEELIAALEAAGAEVTVRACDVSDLPQLRALLDSVDPDHPLGAIVHSAGVLDDGVIASLDAARVQRVFAPKAAAAWHLHELSKELKLSRFILFSSFAGALGGAGQANYAAANAFLDALAQQRRTAGLPAASIGWGLLRSGMGAALGHADLVRMERLGLDALDDEQALALFDAVLDREDSHLLPVRINRAALRAQAAQGTLPAIFGGLVRATARRRDRADSLAKRLAATPEADREALVRELVLSHTATILGHASAAEVDPERAFRELGFDSLAAVELRNGLGNAAGLRLAATIVFDYPTPAALAAHLLREASPEGEGPGVELEPGEREVRAALASISLARLRGAGLLDSLLRLAEGAQDTPEASAALAAELIDEMDVEELVRESVETADSREGQTL